MGWRVGCPKMIIVGVCCAVLQGQGSPPHWDKQRGRDLPTLPAPLRELFLGRLQCASRRDLPVNEISFGAARWDDLGCAQPRAVPGRQQIGTDRPFGDTYRHAPSWSISLARAPLGIVWTRRALFGLAHGLDAPSPGFSGASRFRERTGRAERAGGLGSLPGVFPW